MLHSTFHSLLLRGTITATTKTFRWHNRAPTSSLPEHTGECSGLSHPRAESCRAKAIESKAHTLLLQSRRHRQHYLAGINEQAKLLLENTTAALAQPAAFAQSAFTNTKPERVSAVVKHCMSVVWKHQLQTTNSHRSPLSSEQVFSVLSSVSHPKT